MRRWLWVLILCVFIVSPAYAGPSFSGGGGGTSSEVVVDASGFTGNLSVTDTDIQTALDTIDAVALGGDTTETNQDDAWAAVGASGTESGIDVTYQDATNDVDFIIDVTPSSGSATLEVAEDAVQVKYDSTLTEGGSGLGIIADGVDSAHYAADSIDNEHINWADIDNLGDEGAIVAADESADTTTFVGFFTDATGSAAKTGTNLTFNSSTGVLTATGFAGPLTGNVTGNASGTAATVTGATQASITTAANLTTVGALVSGSLAAGFTDVPIAQGGTNSSTALNNDFVMVSSGGAIVESATVTATELALLNGETDLASQAELNAVAALVDTDDEIIAIINASPGTQIGVAAGGIGVGTLADGGLLIGNGTSAIEVVAAGTTTQILVGGGASTAPVWGTDIPTAVTIGAKYIYRVDGTDIADNDVVDTITASNYLPLAGGTLTAEVTVDDLGLEFSEGDTISDCSNFAATGGGIFYDDSDAKFKKCQDNVLTDLDTDTGGAPALNNVTAPTGAWSIAFDDDEKITWTTSQNAAGNFFSIDNSVADVTNQVYLLNLDYSVDDNQALADYIIAQDAGGTVFTLSQNGDILTTGSISVGTTINPDGDGGASLGTVNTLEWQNLFMNTGAVINFENSDVTLTHSANALTLGGGALDLTSGGITNSGNIADDAAFSVISSGGAVTVESVVFTAGVVTGSTSLTDGTATLTGGALTGLTTPLTVAQGGTGATSNTPTNVTPVDTGNEAAAFYPLIVDGTTGDQATETDAAFNYNPSTDTLTVVNLDVLGAPLPADPAADRILMWDDSETGAELVWTTAGTGDVESVGDCTIGACLDGTSDGGTTISLYDGDSHKLTIDSADLTGDATLVIGSDTNNITVVNGTAVIDIAAAATLNIDTGLQTTTNAGVLAFSAASKTLTVEDSATVSQDMTADATPTFAGLALTNASVLTWTDAAPTTLTHVDNTGLLLNTELEVDGTFDADGQLELGDGGDTVAIDSSDWDIGTTGTITGVAFDVDGTGNTLTNIANANVKAGAGIDATKLADGSISDTELQYLDGLAADLATSLVTGTLQVTTLLNVDEDVDIDFNAADEEVNITNSAEYGADGAQVTIANTDADVGAAMYLLRLRYTDDGQANADFMVMEDNNGDDMITFTDGGQVQAVTLTDGTAIITGGAISAVTTIASGAITSTGLISSSAAAPSLATSDSDDAAGTGSLTFASANTQDVIGSIYVDVAGSATEYVQIDGVSETVDFLKGVTGTDATFTGTTTISSLVQSATAAPTWTTNDSTASADGTFDIRVNAATAKYAGVMNIYVEEGDGAGGDGSETEIAFMTINGSGATSTKSGTIEFERIGNFEMGLSSSAGTTSGGFIDLYEDEDDGSNKVRIIAPAMASNYTITLPTSGGTDGYVLKTDGSGTTSWTTAGSATAWDDITDPDNNTRKTITFDNAAEATTLSSAYDTAGSFFVIDNTDADHANNTYLLDLDYSADDGDVDADYIKAQDSGGVVFTLQQDGDMATTGSLTLDSDSVVISLGDDQDVTITHSADNGLTYKSTATTDNNPYFMLIQTGETDIAVDDSLGIINFQAPDEGTGTDSRLIAAAISAVSEGDFSASNNATKFVWSLGVSEAASEKMSLSSAGALTIASDLTVTGGDITLGTTSIFSGGDTASLNNIDSIDATTESTIETAIDTLSNVTTVGALASGSLAAGFTDVPVAQGGTGASTLNDGFVLLGSGTGAITPLDVTTDGAIVIGDGTTDPVTLDVGSSTAITILGTVATGTWAATDVGVAYGGTGVSTLADGGLVIGNAAGAVEVVAAGATTEILVGGGASTAPVWTTAQGTGAPVRAGSPTLTTPNIGAATGTSLDISGAAGLVLENDETITNTVDGTVAITAPDVTVSGDFAASGTVRGKTEVIITTAATLGVTAAQMKNTLHQNGDADAIDYTLPGAAVGLTACFMAGEFTGVITIDPVDGTDTIYLDGASIGAGDALDSPGTVGDFICLIAIDDTKWYTLGRINTWVDGGVD